MHNLPPPDGSLRNRRGYGQLPTQDNSVTETRPIGEVPEGAAESQMAEKESWVTLVWSFSLSSLMTVGTSCLIIAISFAK